MNTVRPNPEEESLSRVSLDYFVLSARSASWCVSTEMARHVEAVLEAQPRPDWVTFVDLCGSRVRLRTREVEYLAQSTSEQRSTERAMGRALNRESKSDRTWGRDDG